MTETYHSQENTTCLAADYNHTGKYLCVHGSSLSPVTKCAISFRQGDALYTITWRMPDHVI